MSDHEITSRSLTKLTDQQRRAVDERRASIVLASGAGCGKTSVLTERYLSHLQRENAAVSEIVAITFTDRAAREMRGRIRKEITRRLRETTSEAEADTWAAHLRALETAPISTIHAFCASILRQHAIEAGLDPRFEVLEEVLSINLETEALQSCLQRLLTAQTDAGEDLRQLVLLYGWRVVVDAVESLMPAWDGALWESWLAQPVEQVVAAWRREAGEELLPNFLKYVQESQPKIVRCLSLLRRFPPRPGKMADRVQSLFEQLPRLGQASDLAAAIEEIRKTAQGRQDRRPRHGRTNQYTKEIRDAAGKEFREFHLGPRHRPGPGRRKGGRERAGRSAISVRGQ